MAKSKILMMVGLVAGILLLVVCGALVVAEMAKLGKYQKTLNTQGKKIAALCEKDPYPSAGNVKVQNQNVELIQAKLTDMMALLGKANIPVPKSTPAGFSGRLTKVRKELLKMAVESGTVVPDGFAFGFDRWVSGTAPDVSQLDELNRQLSVANVLCRILLEEGSIQLSKVIREEVAEPVAARVDEEEVAAAESTESASEGPRSFQRIRFMVEIVVKESQFFQILNRFASDPMFLVVSSVAMTKDLPDVRKPAPASVGDDDDAPVVTPDSAERIRVSGPAVDAGMRLMLVVDAYHFPGAAPVESAPVADAESTLEEEP